MCGSSAGGGPGPGGGNGTERGLGIAADANGRLWEVVNDGGVLGVVRFTNGQQDFGVALPNATDNDGAWSVKFDRAGNAYVVGTAQPQKASFKDVAVYKVSQAGILVSSAVFHAGDTSQAVAWDANGDLWITGFVQAGTDNNGTLTMGLWHYSMSSGQLSLTTSYSRGGPADAGFGVRILDTSVYVEGYSSTQSLATPSLDLALWKFDSQGHGPVAGPFLDQAYQTNISSGVAAKLEVSSGTLYAAAERSNPAGYSDLGFLRYDANGNILSEHYATVGGDFNLMPAAMAVDAQGNLAVAISASNGTNSGHGVARFARDGGLIGVTSDSQSNAPVYGMAMLGNNIWLAVDGSTVPVLFKGVQTIPATDVIVSSGPVDTGDPVTQLLANGVAASTSTPYVASTTFAFSATDPPDSSGLSSGVAETLYWVDVDPFACDADYDPAQPAGTCANPVYSGAFQLAPGTHTVSFQSTDAAGNSEDMNAVQLTVAAPPLALTSITPSNGGVNSVTPVLLTGTSFEPGATFELMQPTGSTVAFTATTFLPSYRARESAVTLTTGKVLVAGGIQASGNPSNAAFLYDPVSRTWSATGSMATARSLHMATLLPDGRVLVTGGFGASNVVLASAEIYDPGSGTWSTVAPMSFPRVDQSATLLGNGKVLVSGGMTSGFVVTASAEIFDPSNGTWTPAGTMPAAQIGGKAVRLLDGRVLVAGGDTASFGFSSAVNVFDPAAGSWTAAAPLNTTRQNHSIALLPSGKVLVASGANGTDVFSSELYDPAANTWTFTGSLSSPHQDGGMLVLPGGKVLLVGGNAASSAVTKNGELYDPSAGTWSSAGTFPNTAPAYPTTTNLLGDGSVLVVAGLVGSSGGAYLYKPPFFEVQASSITLQSSSQLSGVLNLAGQPLGAWNVVVKDPDGQTATLPNAFTVHDVTPPLAIRDLAVASASSATVTVTWTAPSAPSAPLGSYDLRYAPFTLTDSNFTSGIPAAAPAPAVAGTLQSATVPALASESIAIKSADSFGDVSAMSNVIGFAQASTLVDGQPEASFFAAQPVTLAPVSTASAPGSIALSSAARQGLNLVSGIYELGPEGSSFSPAATVKLHYSGSALTALGTAPEDVKLYELVNGFWVSVASQSLDTASNAVTAPVPSLSSNFALFYMNAPPAVTSVSPNSAGNNGSVAVSISGSGFLPGATVKLSRAGSVQGFVNTGTMIYPRDYAAAVRLANGKVLVAGGRNGNSLVAASEIFDPATGNWSPTGALVTPRLAHTMTLLANGKVLVTGGYNCTSCNTPLQSAELYDPISGTWSATGSMLQSRVAHTATLLPDGRVLVAGGGTANDAQTVRNSAEVYDPTTGTWAAAGTMSSGRFGHAAALLSNGKVMVAGGLDQTLHFIGSVDIFDPAAGTWSTGASMPTIRSDYALVPLSNGKVLAAGGDNGLILASADLYDPAANTWSATGAMAAPRSGHTATALTSGQVLVVGGSSQGNIISAAEVYDPAAGSWSTAGNQPRFEHTATLLANGTVLLAGGVNTAGDIGAAALYGPQFLTVSASTVTVQSSSMLSAVLNLTGQPTGSWDVMVTTADSQSGTLPGGFLIHDATPPNAVTDLAIVGVGASTATIQWTAPSSLSPLASYDLRYASYPITSSNFAGAASAAAPSPAAAGTTQTASIAIGGMTTLYAAMKSQDVYGDVSGLSDVASLTRSTVTVGGLAELSFSAEIPISQALLSTSTGPGSVVLATATGQGLTLVSSIYDLGPEGATFTPSARLTFAYSTSTLATLALLPSDVLIYEYVPGSGMVAISSETVDLAAGTISGYVQSLSSIFAVFGIVKDRTAPITALQTSGGVAVTDAGGRLIVSTATAFGFAAVDPVVFGTATGVAFISYRVDASSTAPFVRYSAPFSLAAGAHTIQFESQDNAGNLEVARSSTVYVDGLPPVVAISSPAAEQVFVPKTSLSISVAVSDNFDSAPKFSLALVELQDTGVPHASSPTTIAVSTGQVIDPLSIDDGVWQLQATATDFIGNSTTVVSGAFQVVHDIQPPRTTVTVGIPTVVVASATFVSGNTPLALSAMDDLLVARDGQGLGVRNTVLTIDGTPAISTSSFRLSGDGAHILSYYSVDVVGNTESTKTLTLDVDNTPLVSTFNISGSSFVQGGSLFVSSSAAASFSANDPAINGVASGVAFVSYSLSSAPFAQAPAAFSFTGADGPYLLSYRAQDRLGNLEAVHTTTVLLDQTPPVTVAHVGTPQILQGGVVYVSPSTPVTLTATDPALTAGQPGSGVLRTDVSIDGGPFTAYTSALMFSEGRHTVLYRSIDNVGNIETTQTLALAVDATPPLTQLALAGGRTIPGPDTQTLYASSGTRFGLTAGAPVSNGVASGVAFTRWQDNGGAFLNFTSSVALAEGAHALGYQSQDNVGNLEVLRTTNVWVDATPPVTTSAFGLPYYQAGDGSSYVTLATPLTFTAADPALPTGQPGSGVARIEASADGGAFAAYVSTLTFAEGRHTVAFRALDGVGNVEASRTLSLQSDATPPLTQLVVSGGRQYPGPDSATFYASSDTRLALTAADPVSNGVTAGVALTRWQDSGGAFQAYASALALGEGAHALSYQSQDRVMNLEVLRSTTVLVDATPPVTTFSLGSTYFKAADGTSYVTPATPLTFTATDPSLPTGQAGSGLARIEVSVDGSPLVAYAQALSFAEGRHTVAYRSVDNVGNVEATRTLSLLSDATPPLTALALSAGHQFPGPDSASFFASADTRFGFAAADPVVSGVATGVSFTRWGDNGGSEQPFTAPFALAEGIHHLAYQSQDNVGNLEIVRSTTALVDATPPLTQLALVGGRQSAGPDGSTFYASSDTRLALIAADPASNGVASGLASTRWQDNNGALQSFAAPFTLVEGAHKLGYQSQDNVANLEPLRSTNVWVDATAPASTFAFGPPYYQGSDGTNFVTPATPLSLSAADPSLPSGQPGSGVNRVEYSLDGAAFTAYAAPLTFAEGRHTLLYRAVDNVGNVEAAHALALQSDATPPVSTLVIGYPQYPLPGTLLVSPRTPFSITAVDPVANNVASGVKDTFYRVSDVTPSTAAFAAFTAPFSVSGLDIAKVVQFYSRDNVVNTEVVKSSTVLLDATPPQVALLSPAGCDSGICRVLKGRFPVLGTASDLHFASFVLDAAPGQDATTGFAQISSGAVAVSSGTLGVWDASKLSGWQTLRLTATDLVQNVSVLTLDVWVGDPAALMVLGNHDTFNMPTGVAVSSGGAIYVADREADRVQVFSSTGALLASFGATGHDSDDHTASTATLHMHEPAGVAVDASGDIFVADTDNSRVLELSPSGQVLLTLGSKPGREAGQFQQPFGVAVDGAGSIYVADTGNHRVQVFSASGAFALQFALPALPKAKDTDSHGKGDDGSGLGKPVAIALDAAGRIYLADAAGHRALIYGSTGTLLMTLPITGDRPDQPGRPDGVAVSPSGDCLLVADGKLDRVMKFDSTGTGTLSFGAKGSGDDPKTATGIVFRKPAGLAIDAAGNLYVADRNNESVKKFGLPNGQPTLVVPAPQSDPGLAARDVVDSTDGGTVARADKTSVAVPPQAIPQDLKITVAPPAPSTVDDNSRQKAQQDNQLKVASPPVEFGPEGTKFATPATLTIPYDPQLVAAQNVSAADLKINYWNRTTQQWEPFDSTVDPVNHTVTAKTSHFSLYQVLSSTPSQVGVAGGPAADATFTAHAVYAFPNPAVRGAKPTIHVAVGVADEVKITILNVAGQEVAHGSIYGTPPVVDDGSGPQYAYEWVWDGHIASGMYFYVVEASKAGYPKIRKAGKLGVVR